MFTWALFRSTTISLRGRGVLSLAGLLCCFASTAQPADPGWPRVFKQGGQQLTVYQPQVSKKDAVTLDVRFSTLDNNATYAASSVLAAKAKHLTVNVQNSGYRRSGN